jgi:hypothetical protein
VKVDEGRITEMKPFPTTKKELMHAVQKLWDKMDPTMFLRHIEATQKSYMGD